MSIVIMSKGQVIAFGPVTVPQVQELYILTKTKVE